MSFVVQLHGGGSVRHDLPVPVPVNELSCYFASLVSSDRGVAPLLVPGGRGKDGACGEFSPVMVQSV